MMKEVTVTCHVSKPTVKRSVRARVQRPTWRDTLHEWMEFLTSRQFKRWVLQKLIQLAEYLFVMLGTAWIVGVFLLRALGPVV